MSEERKTLIILIPGFPKDESDENCLPFPQLFVKTLQKNNSSLDIVVISFQYPFEKRVYQWNGVTVIAFGGRSRGKLYRLILWRNVMKQIKELIEKKKVLGFVSFWLGECGLIAKQAGNKFNLPFFIWLMGQDARENNRYFHLIKPQPEQLISLSDSLSDELYKNYNCKPIYVIPPGINIDEFSIEKMARSIDIIGVGSLIPLKQFHIFIKVIAALKTQNKSIKAVLCGNGNQKDRLIKMIEEYGLQDNITLAGEVPHKNILKLMQQARILLHPSSYEGFATVYNEALFAGCYVIGFCKPMKESFPHLQVVKDEAEMIEKTKNILNKTNLTHEPILTHSIDDTCAEVLTFFCSREVQTS